MMHLQVCMHTQPLCKHACSVSATCFGTTPLQPRKHDNSVSRVNVGWVLQFLVHGLNTLYAPCLSLAHPVLEVFQSAQLILVQSRRLISWKKMVARYHPSNKTDSEQTCRRRDLFDGHRHTAQRTAHAHMLYVREGPVVSSLALQGGQVPIHHVLSPKYVFDRRNAPPSTGSSLFTTYPFSHGM